MVSSTALCGHTNFVLGSSWTVTTPSMGNGACTPLIYRYFRWRRWGSSLLGLRTLDPPLRPPSTPADFFCGHVCKVAFKHLPKPLRSHIRNFGTLGQLLKIPPCPLKTCIVQGVWGSPNNLFGSNLKNLLVRSPCKIL